MTRNNQVRSAGKFTGNFFSSFSGVAFIILTAFPVVIIIVLLFHAPAGAVIFSPLLGWNFLITGFRSYYFILTDEHLIVRNQLWFWYKNRYPLEDIQSITFERKVPKLPRGLEIQEKNFMRDDFRAASLHDETWERLKQALERQGIPVVMELKKKIKN